MVLFPDDNDNQYQYQFNDNQYEHDIDEFQHEFVNQYKHINKYVDNDDIIKRGYNL